MNHLLFDIREPDTVNLTDYDAAPIFDAQFTKAVCLAEINAAIAELIGLAGFPPMVSEKIALFPVTTAIDWALPADFGALRGVRYQQIGNSNATQTITVGGVFSPGVTLTVTLTPPPTSGKPAVAVVYVTQVSDATLAGIALSLLGQINSSTAVTGGANAFLNQGNLSGTLINLFSNQTGVGGNATTVTVQGSGGVTLAIGAGAPNFINGTIALTPYRLEQLTQVEFDNEAGISQAPPITLPKSLPYWFREPVASALRYYPQIGQAQVTNGDQIELTYESTGTVLVNGTDIPGIPLFTHRALAFRAAEIMWLSPKNDHEKSAAFGALFERFVARARMFRWDVSRAGDFGFIDAEGAGAFNDDSASEW